MNRHVSTERNTLRFQTHLPQIKEREETYAAALSHAVPRSWQAVNSPCAYLFVGFLQIKTFLYPLFLFKLVP